LLKLNGWFFLIASDEESQLRFVEEMIEDYTKQWQGIPIKAYNPGSALECPYRIYRIAYSWEHDDWGDFKPQFAKYLADPACGESVGLSLGLNEESADAFYDESVKALIENKASFPKLRWLFLGEMLMEDSELTWIGQGDVGSPVLDAFPLLEELHARGGEGGESGIAFTKAAHPNLKKLVLQTAGLSREAFQGVLESNFPELESLELWLGSDERGADCSVDDLRDLLLGNPFPKLKSLGLMNSEIITDVAKEIANAPILDQLEELSLAGGTLQDDGAKALLASPGIGKLKKLDLSHHYMSTEVMSQFANLGPVVDVSEQEQGDEWDGEVHYYVAISE